MSVCPVTETRHVANRRFETGPLADHDPILHLVALPSKHAKRKHMATFAQPSRSAAAAAASPPRAPSVPSPPTAPSRASAAAPRQLPNGSCNWKDLNFGRGGETCGCRQFWLNDAPLMSNGLLDQRLPAVEAGAWCFCGHHACFHKLKNDASIDGSRPTEQQGDNASWGLPSSFDLDLGYAANAEAGGELAAYHAPVPKGSRDSNKPQSSHNSGLGLFMAANGQQIQMTNPSYLPRPSLLNPAEYLPSTQSSPKPQSRSTSEAENQPRRSPNTAFSNYVASQRRLAPQVNVRNLPEPSNQDEAAQSATEVATPSNAGTPALRETDDAFNAIRTTLDAFNKNHPAASSVFATQRGNIAAASHDNPANVPYLEDQEIRMDEESSRNQPTSDRTTADQLMAHITSLRALLSATPNFGTSLLTLSHRLDALENVSFAQVPVEELQDKFEFFDGRLLEVEGKVDEFEKLQANEADEKHRFGRGTRPDQSFDSNASLDEVQSNYSGSQADQDHHRISYSAALAQLSRLEKRLVDLEAMALPNPATPWIVEVVFIPWGRALKGIWASGLEPSQMSKNEDEGSNRGRSSTLSQRTASHAPINREMSAGGEWTNGSQEWLSPRACGPTRGTAGRVYERLKSRGFVRTVEFKGNSAAKVDLTIRSAFFDLHLATGNHIEIDTKVEGLDQRLLGLRASFIPLRKVHKSSRLRHLTSSELITPSLWTAEFLNSSVFMQTPTTGQRRLFVTTPASYMQGSDTSDALSWQIVRELPRVYPHAGSDDYGSGAVGEADAYEPCWVHDARLDPPISVHSSFSSGISYHSSLDSRPISPRQTNDEDSEEDSADAEMTDDRMSLEEESENEKARRPQSPITPVSEFPLSRQSQRHRTASMPLTQPQASLLASVPKRQIASFEQNSPAKGISKRRRFSRTPDDVELMAMWNLTPRRSREPASPGSRNSAPRLSYDVRHTEAPQASSGKGRYTPQPYATPFSNSATAIELVEDDETGDWRLGDTGADSESESSSENDDEDEDDEDDDASVDMNDEAWEGVDEDDYARDHHGGHASEVADQ